MTEVYTLSYVERGTGSFLRSVYSSLDKAQMGAELHGVPGKKRPSGEWVERVKNNWTQGFESKRCWWLIQKQILDIGVEDESI